MQSSSNKTSRSTLAAKALSLVNVEVSSHGYFSFLFYLYCGRKEHAKTFRFASTALSSLEPHVLLTIREAIL